MNIAYLMNGVIGGLSGKNCEQRDLDMRKEIIKYTALTHKYLKNNDINIDYFIFSWEPELEDYYIEYYNPKKILCVNQIIFDVPLHYIDHKNNPRIQSHYSRWYGAQQVLKLYELYKKTSNKHYDLVINARIDLCFQSNNTINFLEFDTKKFHISHYINNIDYNWEKRNEIADHIFISNSEMITSFLNMFDYLEEYTKPDQCPRYGLISSHYLSVWHLKKINLLKKDIIIKSIKTFDSSRNEYNINMPIDYYIFRYENLTKIQLLKRIYELQRN